MVGIYYEVRLPRKLSEKLSKLLFHLIFRVFQVR